MGVGAGQGGHETVGGSAGSAGQNGTGSGGCLEPALDGLVACYPFSGNADDESGNSHDGVVNGASLTTDRFGREGNAYSFDGVDDFIEVANTNGSFDLLSFTLSVWAKPSASSYEYGWIVYKNAQQGLNQDNFSLCLHEDQSYLFKVEETSNSVDGVNYDAFSSQHADNEWHHVVGTFDGTALRVYVDGIEEDFLNVPQTVPFTGPAPLIIGNNTYSNHPAGPFSGAVDDIRIYDWALSEEHITALYREDGWADD
jgi:hypothetical protein